MLQGKKFTKEKTLVMKGIGILFLFIHHLFLSEDTRNGMEVKFLIMSEEGMLQLAEFSKVCVAIFVFLSAYGMTLSFRKMESDREIPWYVAKRVVSLLSTFFFVFIITHILLYLYVGGFAAPYQGNIFRIVMNWFMDGLGIAYFYGMPMLNATWWYMPVAFSVILILPLLWKTYKILGFMIIPATLLLPTMTEVPGGYAVQYLLAMTMGICAADLGWLEKITCQHISNKTIDKAVKLVIYILCFIVIYELRVKSKFLPLADGLMAFCTACFVNEFVADIPILKQILACIGKYSANIFLTHSLFILYLWPGALYSLKYGILIFFTLFVVTLIVAFLLEVLKRVSRYQTLTDKILAQIAAFEKGRTT